MYTFICTGNLHRKTTIQTDAETPPSLGSACPSAQSTKPPPSAAASLSASVHSATSEPVVLAGVCDGKRWPIPPVVASASSPYICVCMHVCIYLYLYLYLCLYVYIYVYKYIHIYIHGYNMCEPYTYTHARTHMQAHKMGGLVRRGDRCMNPTHTHTQSHRWAALCAEEAAMRTMRCKRTGRHLCH